MKCPVCSNQLHEYDAGSIKVDICRDGCSGIWFDKAELEKCDEAAEPFPKELLRVKKVASVVIDRTKKRECPRCTATTLQRVNLDKDRNFEIDTCPQCHGHWLDIGEIEKMRNDSKYMSEVDARQKTFETRLGEQLKDPTKKRRALAFLQVIFK